MFYNKIALLCVGLFYLYIFTTCSEKNKRMNNLFSNLKKLLVELTTISLQFLCLGVIIQLLIDKKIMGWDPIGNIQDAGSSFIGVIALVLLYILFIKKSNLATNEPLTSFSPHQYQQQEALLNLLLVPFYL